MYRCITSEPRLKLCCCAVMQPYAMRCCDRRRIQYNPRQRCVEQNAGSRRHSTADATISPAVLDI